MKTNHPSAEAHRFLSVHYDLNQPVGVELWRGLKEEARKHRPVLELKLADPRHVDIPENKRCAGMVVPLHLPEMSRDLAGRPYPVFVVSHTLEPTPGLLHFMNDDATVGRLAAVHLWEAGYRSFWGMGYPARCFSQERLQGFAREVERRGGTVRTEVLPSVPMEKDWSPGLYAEKVAEALAPVIRDLPPDTGFFGANDWLAGMILDILRDDFPERLHTSGVIGVDNGGDTRYTWVDARPELSSVIPGFYAIGQAIVRWMTDFGRKEDVPAEGLVRRFAPVGTVGRSSTAGYACAHPVAGRAARWIWEQVQAGEPVQVQDVAAYVNISRRSLERIFAEHYPCGVKEMILRMRMDLARQLMRDTRDSVGDIAFRCGFSSQSVFGRVFREREGATPRDWRREFN
ncbi:MAG: helix-turn-helix domain-containing protein [Verrucomicrobia bacterium]|nr:helix-turn-helix domain-containing protein [Verrucomicrobiota bacterium]MCH8526171.1 helix-turn-helix domain-containing protein [Kiritimatiellia bacterium]